ncbi:hypothetical protein KAR91_60260 [Candidatus Pacearchaeota archaeon]|nr:hypothetical protein [Candidatus Pacearchaeota archaeon]
MAVNVVCNICKNFIKEATEFQSLTGNEICSRCGNKIDELFRDLESSKKKYDNDIQALFVDAKKKFDKLEAIYNRYHSDAKSFYTTFRAELLSAKDGVMNE